jgi:ribonucleoside-diphosphate reductase subunit M1
MERVENDEYWSLFCPNEAPGLTEVWGEEFNKLYIKYESTIHLPRKTVKARVIWVTF